LNENQKRFNYGNSVQGIEVKSMPNGEVWETDTKQNSMLFVMVGDLEIAVGNLRPKVATKGNFMFVLAYEPLWIYARTSTVLIIVRTSRLVDLWDCLRVEQSNRLQKGGKREANTCEIYTSLIQPSLLHFLMGVYIAVLDGIKSRLYYESKVMELHVLLHTYYSKQELSQIFFPVLNKDNAFSEEVKSSWQKYKTIDDLAESMLLSPSSFYRRFQKAFGCSAREWMKDQKKTLIYKDITRNTINFKEMADKYMFSSVSSFSDWCVKSFGDTPGKIRKKISSGVFDESFD
jgi:AraC-like DNA-binding protein